MRFTRRSRDLRRSWDNLRRGLALRTRKQACASMIAPKSYGIYTLAPISLSKGTMVYTYEILPSSRRPVRGGLPV